MVLLCIAFVHLLVFCFFFFFKQKTAYEMRISDWSSDVCSSDLGEQLDDPTRHASITPGYWHPHQCPISLKWTSWTPGYLRAPWPLRSADGVAATRPTRRWPTRCDSCAWTTVSPRTRHCPPSANWPRRSRSEIGRAHV